MSDPEQLKTLKHGVRVWNLWRREHPEIRPDLGGAYLPGVNLSDADLRGADLRGANLVDTILFGANLHAAYLVGADLRGADLVGAILFGTNLLGANLHGAEIGATVFDDVDLSMVRGLEGVRHFRSSGISISTIYLSGGGIPEVFLRGCGVPESFIIQIPALVEAARLNRFHSCFISYSSTDQEFAERLHADLQAKGVRVWFAPHDLPIGARIRPAIDESIRLHDKLLLVLSEHSVSSQWVEQEVETALSREREPGGKIVLFPVRIDDAVMESKAGWPALLKNTRNVGDFTDWKDHDSYRRAFDRLLRDLKAGT
jgi:uncharacterized protein YjbI with pentapeptide repeats